MQTIVGHKRQTKLLKKHIEKNRLSSAYIFFGPAHLGKFTIAKNFSRSILCDTNDDCQSFDKNIHPDFNVIENQGSAIPIAIIRELKKQVFLRPSLSSRKVVIFEEASFLTIEAQNALLKTLEEPPSYAVFILVSQKENLLPTILSRSTKIYFQPISFSEMKKVLTPKLGEERAAMIAHFSQGRFGLIDFADQLIENWQKSLDNLLFLTNSTLKEKMDYAKNPSKDDINYFTLIFRDALYFKINPSLVRYYPKILLDKVKHLSDNFSIEEIKNLLFKLRFAEGLLGTSCNKRLIWENLMLHL